MSYDRSDLIPLTPSLNESSLSPSSTGKGINLLVMHGTADTAIHPQNSMMLVRGVMQQQQQQFVPTGLVSSVGRRNNNSTASGGRFAGGFPTRVGAIRISQLVMPDADLSNSRMATDIENGSPIDNHHQLLHSIFGHVTQYLASECFTSVGDGNRGRGIRTRSRRLRKRRRRRWRTSNRDQEKSEDQQQRGEEHQQRQQNQRSDKSISDTSNESGGGGDRSSGGRYRRHYIDSNQPNSESSIKNDMAKVKIKVNNGAYSDNKIKNISWLNSYMGNFTIPNNSNNRSNNVSKRRERDDDDEAEEVNEEDDEGEESDDEYYDAEEKDEEDGDSEDGDDDDDE